MEVRREIQWLRPDQTRFDDQTLACGLWQGARWSMRCRFRMRVSERSAAAGVIHSRRIALAPTRSWLRSVILRHVLRHVLEHPGGDDQTLNLAGTLVYLGDARTTVHAFDGIFAAVAIAVVNLHRFVGDSCGHCGREKLGDVSFHSET